MPEHADTLAGLYGLRETAPGLLDLIAALGIGLLLAGIVGGLLGKFRARPGHFQLAERIAATRDLAPPDRTAALAAILRDVTDRAAPGADHWTARARAKFDLDGEMMASVKASLYAPRPLPEPEMLEQAVIKAASRTDR